MDQKEIEKRIKLGRSFVVKFGDEEGVDEDYASDQELKKPQPPLTKAPMTDRILDLPTDFSGLVIDGDFLHAVQAKASLATGGSTAAMAQPPRPMEVAAR